MELWHDYVTPSENVWIIDILEGSCDLLVWWVFILDLQDFMVVY